MSLIAFKADEETKERFAALARSAQTTQSDLLRQVVGAVLAKNTGWEAPLKSGHRGGAKGKIDVRLPKDEIEVVRRLAEPERRSAAAWITALVRAKLNGAVPFNPDELKALKEAATQLASIGRNLNALVLHLRRGGQLDLESAKVIELEAAVAETKQQVLELRDRAMKRYTSD